MHYDLIIIGSGAGGATLAHALAPSGLSILVVERGGYLPRQKDNWNSAAVFSESRYKAHETWHDQHGTPFHPGIHYCVGGNTKFYGSALLRMRESDFGAVRHHGGVSPSWPITYADLEPYYTQAERLYHVHGERGTDPTEPFASAPYPYPAVRHEPRIAELERDLRRHGLRPFPLPLGLLLDEDHPETSACIRCNTCDGFPCLVRGKADAHIVCMEPALAFPNVTLKTNAVVTRLETSASGREVDAIVMQCGHNEERVTGDVVVVSAGAINSAVLLLRSANAQHPAGLANASGAVGRHYMAHNNSAYVAISVRPNDTVFQKTLGINDFYHRGEGFEYPLGHIQMLGKSDGEMFRADAPRFTPLTALNTVGTHSLDFWLTSEDLPDPNNRVTVARDGSITVSYTENNLEGHRRLTTILHGLLERIGCKPHLLPNAVYLGKKIPVAGTAHQCGTVRFGADPATSVLDSNCRAHDVDNLYVVDGSFFASSSAVNPALTIIANALRVADHLLVRFGGRDEHARVH